MENPNLPKWANEIPEGTSISWEITYIFDIYDKRFDLYERNGIKYYLYDPTKYGYEKNKKYPLLVFMHGWGCALDGIKCITDAGAEMYASEKYQKLLGGAYILVPMANEERELHTNNIINSWSDNYTKPLSKLIKYVIHDYCKNNGGVYKSVLISSSTASKMTYRILDEMTEEFSVVILASPTEMPNIKNIEKWNKNNLYVFFIICKHDEIINFYTKVKPKLFIIKKIKHLFLYLPDWLYNGRKEISSNYYDGKEMGQHCTIITIQYNLLFNDDTPMNPKLPYGLIDWIKFSMDNKEYPNYEV